MGNGSNSGLRRRFLAWQCGLRQAAMREHGGRPSAGMCPRVVDGSGREIQAALTVLLVPKSPAESTAYFRYQVMKTGDPRDLYERGLTYLQADYYQAPKAFTDTLAAVLPQGSPIAQALVAQGRCVLDFSQSGESWTLPCSVRRLAPGDEARDAALWHNRLFNPALPDSVETLAFEPDWTAAGT